MALAHQAYLRDVPEGDARPDPLSLAVVARATTARLDEIKAWLTPRLPTLDEDQIKFALATAIKAGGADGFRASVHLREQFKWPVDMDLCCYVRDTCNALAFALRVETRIWAVRAGLRFPAKSNDAIEWIEESGRRLAGKVVSVDDSYAAAIVQAADGLIKAGPPRRVFAESVVANTTTGDYAIYQIGATNNKPSN